MTNSIVTPFAPENHMEVQPDVIAQDTATYARARFVEQLQASMDVQAICQILNTVDLRRQGLPDCDIRERDLKDAIRLLRLAKAAVRSLDPEVVEQAVEEAAMVVCEGADSEYAKFADQHPRVQSNYRRLAQAAINAYVFHLQGVRR